MNKYTTFILLLFVGWSYVSWHWYTCSVKGFCATKAPSVEVAKSTENASGVCKEYVQDYLKMGGPNNPAEVTKLQTFLKENEGYKIEVNGTFSKETYDAVESFQTRYSKDVLQKAWGVTSPTGMVFLSTKKKINELYCQKKGLKLTTAK
jgi:Putative peptidoglycan binding domain